MGHDRCGCARRSHTGVFPRTPRGRPRRASCARGLPLRHARTESLGRCRRNARTKNRGVVLHGGRAGGGGEWVPEILGGARPGGGRGGGVCGGGGVRPICPGLGACARHSDCARIINTATTVAPNEAKIVPSTAARKSGH